MLPKLHTPLISWKYLQNFSPLKQKKLQNEKLQQMMHLFPLSSYYSSLFEAHKLHFRSVTTVDDLLKLPFTSKKDIVASVEHQEKPTAFVLDPRHNLHHLSQITTLKIFFSKKLKEELLYEFKPVHVHYTTGRSAMSVPVFYSMYDLDNLKEASARMMSLLKIPHDMRVVNVFPFAPHLAFWQTVYATNYNGIFGIHTGGGKVMGTEKILETIRRMKAEVIIGMPSYVYHLLSVAHERHAKLNTLKYVILGGEAVPPGYRHKIKELLCLDGAPYDVKVYTTYGFTEGKIAWSQCHEDSGYHLYPDMEYVEILDHAGNRVPEGEAGEIVYTSLDFRGSAFLRYKTGDIGRLQKGPCLHCGARTPRLDPAITRSSDIISVQYTKVKGTFVDFNAVAALLSSNHFILDWQLVLQKKHEFGLDEVLLYIALHPGTTHSYAKQEIIREFNSYFHITPEVIFVSRQEIVGRLEMETSLKEKRIVDLRSQKRENKKSQPEQSCGVLNPFRAIKKKITKRRKEKSKEKEKNYKNKK